jgi:nitroreductase
MELTEAIFKRRSIRKFTNYYVTDEEIKQILEAGRWAPSWANTQAWIFIVVRDKDIINKVTSTYSETNPARPCSFTASVLIAACAKKGISGCKDGVERTKFNNWFMFDLGLAVQNISLKTHELGLGSVIVGSMDHNKCNSVLSVQDEFEVVAIIPIGKPDSPATGKSSRKPLGTITYLNKFGEPYFG